MKEILDRKGLSIRMTIIITFVVLMLTTVTVIGYTVFSNWRLATDDILSKMENDVNGDIFKQIETFVNVPVYVNQMNHGLIENGIINIYDTIERESFFVGVLKTLNGEIYSFSYGTQNGEYYGARRNEKNEIEIMKNNADTDGYSWYYSLNKDLIAGKLVVKAGKFDPRTRDWYKSAQERQKPVFSPVYKHFVMDDLTVSAAYPIYNKKGELQGVLGTHIILSKINSFLKEIVKSKRAIAYIVEESTGELVANSYDMTNFKTLADGNIKRMTIKEIDNQAIKKAYRRFKENSNNSNFTIKTENDRLHIKLTEYKKEGLEWLIITAIPESQFTSGIAKDLQATVVLTIIALMISIIIYMKCMDIVLKPIYNLISITEKFSKGDLSQRVKIFRNDETGKLSKAFNKMAETLYILINTLEERVTERTVELEKTNIALKENEGKLQLLLDSTAEGIYGIDMNGNCTFCNDSCLKLLGYQQHGQLIGEETHGLFHHSRKDGTPIMLDQCQVITTFIKGKGVHVDDEVFWRSDGTCFDVEYYSYPQFRDGEVIGAVVTFMDITNRKKAESDITYLSYHDSLTDLYNRRFFEEELIRVDIERNLPISIIMGDVNGLKLANDIFGHAAGDVLLQKAAEAMKNGCRADDIIARWGGDEFIMLLPKTRNETAEEIAQRIKDFLSKESIKAFRGSISLGCGTKNLVNEDISQTLESAEEKMYSEKTLDRKNFSKTAIEAIIKTFHGNSSREEDHSKRVSELCQDIGRAMNLSEAEIIRLKNAGFLHDIGKMVIEENLLNKSDHLTDREWQEIKQHPVVGYRILNSSDTTLELAKYILSHHERWDGCGYPKGMKGEAIPKLARIIALAESYDAMTNGLTYKNAMSKEEAVLEIEQNAGSQFDPSIAAIFVEMLKQKE